MALKGLTIATDTQNIDAADDRECLAGICGTGSYVYDTGNKLAATLDDANHVTIATGAGVMQGTMFRNTASMQVTIESGSQTTYRKDLIGVKFERDATGKESMTLDVVKGTPAASLATAAVPSYTEGDLLAGDDSGFFPLYRVDISGVSPATPVKLFSTLPTIADTSAYVKQATNGCRIWAGTKVVSFASANMNFLSPADLKSITGETLSYGHYACYLQNGDDNQGRYNIWATIGQSGHVNAHVTDADTGLAPDGFPKNLRVNYLIVTW